MIARAYLGFWLLLTGASVGAIAWRAVHSLTGGPWGDALEPAIAPLRRLLPVAAMVGLPLLIGASHVFPWIDDGIEENRRWYLNYGFLAGRTIGCFVVWGIAWWASRKRPGPALIGWLFACGVFATDWIVSLNPAWRSSVIGLTLALEQLIIAFTVAVAIRRSPASAVRDLAGLLLALCLGWAYLAGIDYLTAWMTDLPYEAAWYLPRVHGAWGWIAIACLVAHLLIAPALLLWRGRTSQHVRGAAFAVLFGQACHVCWLVMP